MRILDALSCVFYYVIMKILNIIALTLNLIIPNRTVYLPRYITATNSTGNSSYSGFAQISYEYQVDDMLGGLMQQTVANIPLTYLLNIIINFNDPVDYATVRINLTTPQTNTYSLNYVVENCKVVSGATNQIEVTAHDTTTCRIWIVYSYEQVKNMYGYNWVDDALFTPYEAKWISSGQNYLSITSAYLTSCLLVVDPNTAILTSINNNVDTLESLLNSLITNTNAISTINTNIADIENYLNNILTAINNLDNQLDTISWINLNSQYQGYTTDFTNYDTNYGNKSDGYFVYNVDLQLAIQGIIKIVIPIGNTTINFSDLEFYQYYNGYLINLTPVIRNYLYFANRNSIVIYFYVNDQYVGINNGVRPFCIKNKKTVFFYGAGTYGEGFFRIPQDDIEYWTIYSAIKTNSNFITLHNDLQQIVNILGQIDISQSDLTDKNTVDNYFNQLKQNLQYPSIPALPEKINLLKETFNIVGGFINNPDLALFKWILIASSVYSLLWVIL